MLRKIEFPMGNLHQLVQIDDASVGVMMKAIYRYATTQEAPDFGRSNQLLSFVFAIFQPLIDEQIAKSEHRSCVNSSNAKGKSGNGNDKPPKARSRGKKSESLPNVSSPCNLKKDTTTGLSTSSNASNFENPSVPNEQIPFSQIASIYSKKANSGPFYEEAVNLWTTLSEEEKSQAIAFTSTHLASKDPKFLNEYLKLKIWRNTGDLDVM